MDDIFEWCKEGNALRVRVWLEDTSHDVNQGDDHGFSPLHWSAFYGHNAVVDLLLSRGAQINATNMGRDTALHLASAHGHKDVVHMLLKNNADINAVNEHGNTPLHYACFWGYQQIAEELMNSGAIAGIANKYGEIALDKCKGKVKQNLQQLAEDLNLDLGKKIQFREKSWSGSITKTRNSTLSRNPSLNRNELDLKQKISTTPSGETWKGILRKNGHRICAQFLAIGGELTPRILSDFSEEYQRLRIFSHPNVLPVIGCVDCPPNLIVVNEYMPYGSLYHILHESAGVVVDTHQAIKFAIDVARGMAFLHTLNPLIPRFHLSSKHVMIDEDLTARINMAHTKFSFQDRNKIYKPAWMSPEALSKKPADISIKAADMWSFSILLWELATREVPFADLSPMEIGMKVALEALRVTIPPGISPHMARLIKICMNEEPGKRPSFDQVIPILDKMKLSE